jgi:O-antigen ligase
MTTIPRSPSSTASRDQLIVCVLALLVCVIFGGATRNFQLGDVFAEALCVPLLFFTVARVARREQSAVVVAGICVAALFLIVPLLQLIPLPPGIWTRLPGREPIAATFRMAGAPLPWLGASLAPASTRQSLFSLLPAATVFLSAAQLDRRDRRVALGAMLGVGAASVVIGMLQVAQGPDSPLRLYFADPEAVGLFANRNHYAALLYCCVMIAATWFIAAFVEWWAGVGAAQRRVFPLQQAISVAALAALVGLLLLGLVLAQSRAGLVLAILAIILAFAATIPFAGGGAIARPTFVAALAITLLAGASVDYLLYDTIQRAKTGVVYEDRARIAARAKPVVAANFPIGSGFGTFPAVYAANETNATAFPSLVNRAHNEYVEWLVEGGVFGGLMIVAGAGWLAWVAGRVWLARRRSGFLDNCLSRACAAAPALLLIHSGADYPLRTVAVMGVAALAVGAAVAPDDPAPASAARGGPPRWV